METWGISPNLGNITKEWAEEEALVETETESSEFGAGRGGGELGWIIIRLTKGGENVKEGEVNSVKSQRETGKSKNIKKPLALLCRRSLGTPKE